MMVLPFTSLFAAGFALALVALSVPVTLRRVKVGEMVGDSADQTLKRLIRAQGNFVEYVPLGLIVLGLVEVNRASNWLVIATGAALAFGRLLHAIGMWHDSAPLRGFGMILTYLALLLAAGRLLVSL